MVEETKGESGETDMVAQANSAAERLEKANKENAELLKKMESLESRRILGGQSKAGETPPPAKEETPAEYAKRIMGGK